MKTIYNILEAFQKGSVPTQENFIDAFKFLDNNQVGAVRQFLQNKNIIAINGNSYVKLDGSSCSRLLYPELTRVLTQDFTLNSGDNISTLTLPSADNNNGIVSYVNAGLSATILQSNNTSRNNPVYFFNANYQPTSMHIKYSFLQNHEISDIIVYQPESTLPVSQNTAITLNSSLVSNHISSFYVDYNNYSFWNDKNILLEFNDVVDPYFDKSDSTSVSKQTTLQINLTSAGINLYNNHVLTAHIPVTQISVLSAHGFTNIELESFECLGDQLPAYLNNKYNNSSNVSVTSSFSYQPTTLTKVASAIYITLPAQYSSLVNHKSVIHLTYEI